ncbi:MAG: HD-GYP domain-containing protein [Halanaerobiaceae bacterium]
MRLIHVDNITSDMTLGRPIFHEGRKLLEQGVSNLPLYKNRLKEIGVNYLYVNDELSRNIEINDVVKQETKQKGKKVIRQAFKDIRLNKKLNVKQIKKTVNDIVDEILNENRVLVNMIDLKKFDTYTFDHSINVTILSLLVGKFMDYNRKKLAKIGLGSILHDIGKGLIPEDIIKKEGKLTDEEYEVVKKHPRLGYNHIRDNYKMISPLSRTIILGHHERIDGSGYPRGIENEEIHEFAKIAAITDVFDALTSDRVYRDKMPIPQAIDFLTSRSSTYFEKKILKVFLRHLAIYPNGTEILLSNGKKAIVKEQNKNYPTRPVVITVEEKKEINLLEELNLVIKKVV